MADLKTTYMGIPVKNPLIAGASSLTSHMESIKKIEDAGAGALVISSLFEEQIQLQRFKMEQDMSYFDNLDAEIQSVFPKVEHAGPEEHLMWVRKTKETVDIPVIASLNCVNTETWVEWALNLEETGVDGLELNFFAVPTEFDRTSQQIEEHEIKTVKEVISKVKIPVSAKLSPFYTSPLAVVKQMDQVGVGGFVIFNRLFHPSFDIDKETTEFPFNLSSPNDHRLPIRYVGLLAGNIKGSICASNGIHTGADAVEVLLAGADVFQAVSTLYLNGVDHIKTMLAEIERWMDRKGYGSLADFRGKLSVGRVEDKWTYRRAQYVKMLLQADKYVKRSSSL